MIHWTCPPNAIFSTMNFVERRNIFKFSIIFLMLSNEILMVISEPRIINVNNPGPNDKVDILQFRQNSTMNGQMRNALKSNAQNRWTKYRSGKSKYLIPYVISGSFSQTEHRIIRKAMHSIAKNTCVQFKRRKGEADYVDLQNRPGEGCYTMVGMVRGHNVVMLESSSGITCVTYVTVLHELMHKLGLWHEQMRYDRDKYIKVHWENIPAGLRDQFAKVPSSVSSLYRVRYDYKSAMHYTKNAFANRPDQITMETKKKQYQNVIGMAKHASKGDWKKICGIYKCKRCMGKTIGGGKRKKKGGRRGGRKKSRMEKMKILDNPKLLEMSMKASPMENGTKGKMMDSTEEQEGIKHSSSEMENEEDYGKEEEDEDEEEEEEEEIEEDDENEEDEDEMEGKDNDEKMESEEMDEEEDDEDDEEEESREEGEENVKDGKDCAKNNGVGGGGEGDGGRRRKK